MSIRLTKAMPWKHILQAGMLAVILAVTSPFTALAQQTASSAATAGMANGVVVDENGEPLIGASVLVKGSTIGVTTDFDGNFSIKASKGATLVISFIGYVTQEVKVTGSPLDVRLKPNNQMLEEVVVVGYGTQKKATMTGSVAVVDGKVMESKGSLSSPVQAIQGQVPGVIVTRNSSAPGDESWNMTLRGAVSANSATPLVIIDGVEYESINDLRLINPSDIESMNFLKDASASIYGSKAAGGVILITTKNASAGKVKVDYNGSFTYKHIGLSAEMLSLEQWADGILAASANDGAGPNDTWVRYAQLAKRYKNSWIKGNPLNMSNVDEMVFFDTDWQDVMWGDSWSTQHELSVSGGTDKNTYRFSLGYMYDDSNLKWGNNNNQRINLRLNNTMQLAKNLKLQSVIAYNRQDQVAPTQIGAALTVNSAQPGFPTSTASGKPYAWGRDWRTPNWLVELGGDNKLKVNALNISETLRYEIIKDLSANVVLGYNHSEATRDTKSLPIDFYQYDDAPEVTFPLQKDTYYDKTWSQTDFYSIQGYLNYARTFNEDHNMTLMAGMQYNLKQYEGSGTHSLDIQPSLNVPNGTGEITFKDKSVGKWEEAILSYYGRANYDYKGKYMIEAQARYDGSSKFRPENRWAFFWGTSLGWRISEEKFMEGLRPWVNDLKLRASYGNVGNQSGIDRYDGTLLYNMKSGGGALIGGQLVGTLDTNGKLVSTDRTWERIHNYNIALDFGFLNSRLRGTVEAFWKHTNNMLIGVTYPGILGDTAPTGNHGKFKAWGYEGQINWNDRIGNVTYHVGGTFTYTDNELVDRGGSGVIQAGMRSDREGYPLRSIFGLRYCGKIENEEMLAKYKARYQETSQVGNIRMLRVGDNMFEDVNKDGKLTADDYVYLGTDDPKIQFSFNFGAEWKGFDVNFVFQGAGKRTVYRRQGNGNSDPWQIPMRNRYQNGSNHWVGNVWSPETPGNRYCPLTFVSDINNYNYQCSSWLVNDGSYLRLKNFTVGWTMPQSILSRQNVITNLRLYITGTDLWEKTHIHDGWDPEAASTVTNMSRYPFNRTWTFGANITF